MLDPKSKPELIRLVRRVLQDKASSEEKQFVEKYYGYFDTKGFEPGELSGQEKKRMEDKILYRIYNRIDARDKHGINHLFRNRWIPAAAAIAVLLIIGSWYFHYHFSVAKADNVISPAKKYTGKDVAPGGNKAVLTLSNGLHVMLDSVNSGMLTTQGSSRILKINSGQLVYNPVQINSNRDIGVSSAPAVVKYNTLTTPRGGQYQLTLSDGTKVWLNSASSLTFPTAFTGKEREVVLTGEAYFEVKENKHQPFRVKAGDMEIEDLGTHFDVMAYVDEPVIQTTLLEGSVRVSKSNASALLHPGQQAKIMKGESGRIHVSTANTGEAVAWKNGYFSFERTSIYEIMRQISRWYDVDVAYKDSLHVFLNGHISKNVNASEVFKMLELTGELQFTINGKKVIVRKQT